MSEQELGQAFQLYYTTKGETGGSGIGLPITAETIHDIGGDIELVSEKGVGTTASIRIPLEKL